MIQNDFYFWSVVAILSIGTFSIRGSFIFLSSVISISPRTKEVFSFIPAAILPALVAPAVFYHEGQVDWLFEKERLFVIILATGFWFLSRSMFQTILFGLVTLYLINTFL